MDQLTQALWELRQHMVALCATYQLDVWPTVPGYESLIKGIEQSAGLEEEQLLFWFENNCESLEQLQEYIRTHKSN
ncbi:hypothetical protein [Rheinheimera sp. 4Y26]|uniref:hypothetical protein n=1 Tax=Rheinheimera sp. 4Y26 TaxID=2977811 RepID=UPI0021B0C5C6|nr:hypothetical protein [Rheinheimera sp. 4Y26]MCT6700898.1 hypothetical protein [Rheinheimera sp. 4Y26]